MAKSYSFEAVTAFLQQNQDIFTFKFTEFFQKQPWEKLPREWLDTLSHMTMTERNSIPLETEPHPALPTSLNEFIQAARSFSATNNKTKHTSGNPDVNRTNPDFAESRCESRSIQFDTRGMNAKKVHEVRMLSEQVHDQCVQHGCQTIIDVGSGLGYVSRVLSGCYGHNVIGLEKQNNMVEAVDPDLNKSTSGKKIALSYNNQVKSSLPERNPERKSKLRPDKNSANVQENFALNKDAKKGSWSSEQFTLLDNEDCFQSFEELLTRLSGCGTCERKVFDNSTGPNKNITNCVESDVRNTDSCAKLHVLKPMQDSNETTLDSRTCVESNSVDNTECECLVNTVPDTCQSNESCDGCCCAKSICMMGLHCCGDLTPTMLKAFVRCSRLKSLVCLGCCYHRMTQNEDAKWRLFPLSQNLKQALDKLDAHDVFTTSALRLASEQSVLRWSKQSATDVENHTKSVAYRAILGLFCEQEKIVLKKRRRRIAGKAAMVNFESYIREAMNSFDLGGLSDETVKEKLKELYEQNKHFIQYIEVFKCLQMLLQPVLEWFVVQDRVAYLQENGINARAVELFSPEISPRNTAIIAYKT